MMKYNIQIRKTRANIEHVFNGANIEDAVSFIADNGFEPERARARLIKVAPGHMVSWSVRGIGEVTAIRWLDRRRIRVTNRFHEVTVTDIHESLDLSELADLALTPYRPYEDRAAALAELRSVIERLEVGESEAWGRLTVKRLAPR